MDLDILRTVLFRPYRRGMGPAFVLTMWATPRTDNRGQTVIGYRLTCVPQSEPGATSWILPRVIFERLKTSPVRR
jgi:hypothetical protein